MMSMRGFCLATTLLIPLVCGSSLAQEPTWRSGIPLGTGDHAVTRTLTLETGDQPGQYRLRGADAMLEIAVLSPDTNRSDPMPLRRADEKRNVYGSDGIEITVFAVDSETALIEFQTSEQTRRLALMEIRSDTSMTTMTLQREHSGVIFSGEHGTVNLRTTGRKALRTVTPDGVRIVAPLDSGSEIRLSISREEMTDEEIRAIDISTSSASGGL